jgi:enoyl-CoA hydratase/carnithine racemase
VPHDGDVLYEVGPDGVAVLTFNRPASLNALTPHMLTTTLGLLRQADRDEDVRVLVLTGAGKGFCAGADLAVLDGLSEQDARALLPPAGSGPVLISELGVPVLSAVNGAAVGLGLGLALCTDLRFAASDAKLGLPFTRLGLVAEFGTAWLLPRLVGPAHAADLLLSGRLVTGSEALAMGLVQRALPAAEVLPATLAYARTMAAECAPLAMAQTKAMLRAAAGKDLATAYAESVPVIQASLDGSDMAEGVAARRAGRSPHFRLRPRE